MDKVLECDSMTWPQALVIVVGILAAAFVLWALFKFMMS